MKLEGQEVKADKIISFLAEKGQIIISNSIVQSKESISMISSASSSFKFGNESVSETPSTSIKAGKNAYIEGRGGARIDQDSDGNINFYT